MRDKLTKMTTAKWAIFCLLFAITVLSCAIAENWDYGENNDNTHAEKSNSRQESGLLSSLSTTLKNFLNKLPFEETISNRNISSYGEVTEFHFRPETQSESAKKSEILTRVRRETEVHDLPGKQKANAEKCETGKCKNQKKCNCCPGYGVKYRSVFNEYVCQNFYCGSNYNCTFEGNKKTCLCPNGYAEKYGRCSECKCGGDYNCTYEEDRKTCLCPKGYGDEEGKCVECDCGGDYNCTYQGSKKSCLCPKGYGDKEGKCVEQCDGTKKCQNGGTCTEKSFCKCKKGTSGHFCEIVDACKNKTPLCGDEDTSGAKCIYDDINEKAVCACNDNSLPFDEQSMKCREQCDGTKKCQNGGTCTEKSFCKCKKGTSGHFCETVDACKNETPLCGDEDTFGAKCLYDDINEKAVCACNDNSLHFDEQSMKCREPCDDTNTCQNGGTCVEGTEKSFCKCKKGTSGHFCETVDACENKTPLCGDEVASGAKCIYDDIKDKAVCVCNDNSLNFDEQLMKCRVPCDDSTVCLYGATCDKCDEEKFCRCKKGTSGHTCEVVDACENNHIYCGDKKSGAICDFDQETEKAACMCKDPNLFFDERTLMCKVPCDELNACHNGGKCDKSGGKNLCKCKKGTSGHFCEIVDDCESKTLLCGDEVTSGAKCKYDESNEKAICICEDKTLSFDGYTLMCRATCDATNICKNGGTCNKNGEKNFCNCKKGTSGFFCEVVDGCANNSRVCGDEKVSGARCVFDETEEKAICRCANKTLVFDEKDLMCRDKCWNENCNDHGVCEIDNGEAKCNCHERYDGKLCETDKCSTVDCRGNGECVILNNKAICKCKDEYEGEHCEKHKCLKMDCNENGICKIKNAKAICECDERYEGENCQIDKCSSLKCKNKGECKIVNKTAICDCKEGYEGKNCEIDKCSKLDCSGHGECKIIHKKPTCKCNDGYIGENCEIETCLGRDCSGNGHCKIVKNKATCECDDRYEGDNCEIDKCFSQHCGENGECVIVHKKATCECNERYEGDNCEIDKCFNRCSNGNGKCKIVGKKAICDCNEGYEGVDCEREISTTQSTSISTSTSKPATKPGSTPSIIDKRTSTKITGTTESTIDEDECSENFPNCKETGGVCEKNKTEGIKCVCPRKMFYVADYGCKRPCKKETDCQNGGNCKEIGDKKFCQCIKGTNGPSCENVDDCENNSTFCGNVTKSGASCTFNVGEGFAECTCKNKSLNFDEHSLKCREICDSTNRTCKNGAICNGRQKHRFCDCKRGTSGHHCEIIDGCRDLNCKKSISDCIYNNVTEEPFCNCKKNNAYYDSKTRKCNRKYR